MTNVDHIRGRIAVAAALQHRVSLLAGVSADAAAFGSVSLACWLYVRVGFSLRDTAGLLKLPLPVAKMLAENVETYREQSPEVTAYLDGIEARVPRYEPRHCEVHS